MTPRVYKAEAKKTFGQANNFECNLIGHFKLRKKHFNFFTILKQRFVDL